MGDRNLAFLITILEQSVCYIRSNRINDTKQYIKNINRRHIEHDYRKNISVI